jgi:RND family efflux transporter MFP subunit
MQALKFCGGLSSFFFVLAGAEAIADEPLAETPEVAVARPLLYEVTDYEEFTGRTEAPLQVEVRARVTGYLLKSAFREGTEVTPNDLLFEIDPRIYRAELEKADAALDLAESRLKLAHADRQRAEAALAHGKGTREEYDRAGTEQTAAEAAVRLAKAGREIAKLNLDLTRVVAPVGGQIGRRLVDPGNLVKADDTLLAVIVGRDLTYALFNIDERTLLRLRSFASNGKASGDKVLVAVGLATEEGFPRRGVVDFIDNRVDAETGTVRLRAVLPNPNKLLLPGMFIRVRLLIGPPHKALLVPEQAIVTEDGRTFLFVVNENNLVERRLIALGQSHDGLRTVKEGLKADSQVVIEGHTTRGLQPLRPVRPTQRRLPAPAPLRDGPP